MENVIIGTSENVKSLIEEGKTTIVDFYAEWCGPCKVLGPILDKVAAANPEVNIIKVNVEDNSDLSSEFEIRSIPAVFIFKNGELTDKFVGVKKLDEINSLL